MPALQSTNASGAYRGNSLSGEESDYRLFAHIPFGSNGQHLDIYAPRQQAEPAPVIVFFYGGGWNMGNKEIFAFVGDALACRGYIVVIADYRKYPHAVFPAFMEDGAQVIKWTIEHIAEYGGNPHNLFIAGHSSGAHMAALLICDGRYLQKAGAGTRQIRAFAGLAGPYHFKPEAELYKSVFGPPENYPLMQVGNFISGCEPPMLLMAGDNDETVDISNLTILKERIEQSKGVVETKLYQGFGHSSMIMSLACNMRNQTPLLDDIDHFFLAHGAK